MPNGDDYYSSIAGIRGISVTALPNKAKIPIKKNNRAQLAVSRWRVGDTYPTDKELNLWEFTLNLTDIPKDKKYLKITILHNFN